MNIAWQYLDKRSAAVSALKDYGTMRYIIAHSDEDIRDASQRMARIGAAVPTDMPKSPKDPKAAENRMICGMDAIDVITARCRHALEFMDWFQPSWEALTEDERVLSVRGQRQAA